MGGILPLIAWYLGNDVDKITSTVCPLMIPFDFGLNLRNVMLVGLL